MSILPNELNTMFKNLYKPANGKNEQLIDYNFYVDDILEIAPPVVHKNSRNGANGVSHYGETNKMVSEMKVNSTKIKSPEKDLNNENISSECPLPMLSKGDSTFLTNSYCETPTLATSWSYLSNLSKSGNENNWFEQYDSELKAIQNIEIDDLPTLNTQPSLFSSFWNKQASD